MSVPLLCMKSIAERVIDWNALRYDQVYDSELACKLLLEETEELFATTDPIEKLDAIGDIVFVAIGVMWKLGFSKEQINHMFNDFPIEGTLLDLHNWSCYIEYKALDEPCIQACEGAYVGLKLALISAFVVAFGALQGMEMQTKFYDIVHAICDSNDTKVVKGKTAANVKANIIKGNSYVSPTAKLEEIYRKHYSGAHTASTH